jgi:hypothetical protein
LLEREAEKSAVETAEVSEKLQVTINSLIFHALRVGEADEERDAEFRKQ